MADLDLEETAQEEVAPAQRRKIEIRISDDYRRAKRNHLFASSVVLVLALAAQSTINIPGFPEANLQAPMAIALAWLGALFFAEEFRSEYMLARIRNAEINARETDQQIEDAFAWRLQAITEFGSAVRTYLDRFVGLGTPTSAEKISDALDRMEEANQGIADIARGLQKGINQEQGFAEGVDLPADLGGEYRQARYAAQSIEANCNTISETTTVLYEFKRQATDLAVILPSISERLDQQARLDGELRAAFRRTSRSIHAGQRWSFNRDAIAAILIFAAATLAVAAHEIRCWRGSCPIASESKTGSAVGGADRGKPPNAVTPSSRASSSS